MEKLLRKYFGLISRVYEHNTALSWIILIIGIPFIFIGGVVMCRKGVDFNTFVDECFNIKTSDE